MKKQHLYKTKLTNEFIESSFNDIKRIIRSGDSHESRHVTKFENALKKYFRTNFLLVNNNFFSSITLALRLSGVCYGDHVISSPLAPLAINMAILNLGAKIVWSDVSMDNGMISANAFRNTITYCKTNSIKPKAAIISSWCGATPDIHEIGKSCKRNAIASILDASHAIGATQYRKQIYHWADYAIYSCSNNDLLPALNSSILITGEEHNFIKAMSMKNLGIQVKALKEPEVISDIGYDFTASNIACAIGFANLDQLEQRISRQQEIASRYDKIFLFNNFLKPVTEVPHSYSTYHSYSIVLKNKRKFSRDEFVATLNSAGVMANTIMKAQNEPEFDVFHESNRELPWLTKFMSSQFSIPCGWWMTDDDVNIVAGSLLNLGSK